MSHSQGDGPTPDPDATGRNPGDTGPAEGVPRDDRPRGLPATPGRIPPADRDHCAPPPGEIVSAGDAVIGGAFRWSAGAIVLVGLTVAVVLWWSGRPEPVAPPVEGVLVPARHVSADAKPPTVVFTDVTLASGIDFVHENGAYGDKLLPETMGGGVALFDYDNDGDLDLLFVNGNEWPDRASTTRPTAARLPTVAAPPFVLYRNAGDGAFERVLDPVEAKADCYGVGVAVGDYDNDGWVDLFLSGVGPNRLLRNTGDGFEDVTSHAGVAGDARDWGTSSAFIDYDNDGDLDLFVGNYVRWSKEIDFAIDYRLVGVGRAYGPPMNFEGAHAYLYRNDGDGTFSDVSADAGVRVANPATGVPAGKALGVAPIDVDRDGWIDLLVANDTVGNFFFHNQGDGSFLEEADFFGLAYDPNGNATGGMGIDAAYYRNNDDLGFVIGNFANEMTTLYVSQGDATMYADEAIVENIGSPTRSMLTFGVSLFDYDLDGRLDLLHANGHFEESINLVQPSQQYRQAPQLFWNCGPGSHGCFVPVEPDRTGDLRNPVVGRASAVGDIDGDGDLDVVITQVGRRPVLLRNDQQLGHHWLRLKLVGTRVNRDAIGAWVQVSFGDVTVRRQVMPTRSYLSQSEPVVTIGLGKVDRVDDVTVTWPGGATEIFEGITVDSLQSLREGAGRSR